MSKIFIEGSDDDRELYHPYTPSRMNPATKPVNYLFEIGKQLSLHPDKWRQVLLKPETNLVEWFVGMTMKETHGKADPVTLRQIYVALRDVGAW